MKKGTNLKSEIERIQKISKPPAQYQKGWTEFYKLKFFLTRDVLIPRPETELLVDEILQLSKLITHNSLASLRGRSGSPITILDVGTGSGCIAISIAKNLPTSKIIATDISKKALEVAQKNAKYHKVEKQIIFLEADLLPVFKKTPDIIVANLPYIPTARLMFIDPMVTEWEPKVALDGGSDGFDLYRKLFEKMKNNNIIPKFLIAEIDYTQPEIAKAEVLKHFPKSKPEIKLDLAKKQRILLVKF